MARKQQQPIEHPSSALSDRATIRRAAHDRDNPYFLMRRDAAQDSSLSFEARGILAYLLSKPDDWKVYVRDLEREGSIGRDQLRRILRELETAQYLTRQRGQDRRGRWDWECLIYEKPALSPSAGFPSMDNPATGKPATENPAINKTKKQENTDRKNNRTKNVGVGGGGGAENAPRLPHSRYPKWAIRRYVDSIDTGHINSQSAYTHELWLSGGADEDVAVYLKDDTKWLAKAPTRGLEIALEIYPGWANTDNWKSWEGTIKTLVISHFHLWEQTIYEVRAEGHNVFPMQEAIDRYLETVNEVMARAA